MNKTDKNKIQLTEAEQKYILKAAKLKGVPEVEIEGLRKHFSGEMPNDFVVRRNADLFKLLDKRRKSKKGLIKKSKDEAYINLENVIVSTPDTGISHVHQILTPGLTTFISKPVTNIDKKSKFHDLARKNQLVLPHVANAFGVKAATFLEVELENGDSDKTIFRHITQDLVEQEESFITGIKILKLNQDKEKNRKNYKFQSKKMGMNSLLEKTDKFVRKFCKKEQISEKEAQVMREDIRKELIKQTFINKLVLNDDESNQKWGILKSGKNLNLLPLHNFEYCAGVINSEEIPTRRVVSNTGPFGGREDIQSFMLFFGKEKWFRAWVIDKIQNFSIDNVFEKATQNSNVELTENEKEYYSTVLDKTLSLAKEVIEVNFDEKQFGKLSLFKNRPTKIRKEIYKNDDISFEK